MAQKRKRIPILDKIFIDGLSGMALGLFATLIIGTIVGQAGSLIGGSVGRYLVFIANVAKSITGAGIGVGVAVKFKEGPLVTVSAAVCGMIGAFPSMSLDAFALGKPGEPLGAFVAALVAIELGHLVAGRTPVDILVTPLVSILTGSMAGIFVGPYISKFMSWLGNIVNINVEASPIVGGIIVSVVTGMILTAPISSAAICVSLGLKGLAAGAATIGCCANMVGFAVASYRENRLGGLLAQGLGTSMLQVPNIVRRPLIWLPEIITSALLAPISTAVLKMTSNSVGAGMGTSGLVGPLMTWQTMYGTISPALLFVEILFMYFILPGAITLTLSEGFRKAGWIKYGDMKLEL